MKNEAWITYETLSLSVYLRSTCFVNQLANTPQDTTSLWSSMHQSNNEHSIEGKDLLMKVFLKFLDVLLFFRWLKNVQKLVYVEEMAFLQSKVATFRCITSRKNSYNRWAPRRRRESPRESPRLRGRSALARALSATSAPKGANGAFIASLPTTTPRSVPSRSGSHSLARMLATWAGVHLVYTH